MAQSVREFGKRMGPTITLVIAIVGSVGSGVAYLESKIEQARQRIENAKQASCAPIYSSL